jgi:putative Holliday junction resolvase
VTKTYTIGYLKDVLAQKPPLGRLAGLDVGKKTIGLAVSDDHQRLATPVQTIKRVKFTQDIQALGRFMKEYEVVGLVVGLPLNDDGSEGPRAQSVRDFVQELVRYPEVLDEVKWIAFWDETLSTSAVEDLVHEHVGKKKTRLNAKASGLLDRLAAQHILQGALDWVGFKVI